MKEAYGEVSSFYGFQEGYYVHMLLSEQCLFWDEIVKEKIQGLQTSTK